jgi:hypothetical protein
MDPLAASVRFLRRTRHKILSKRPILSMLVASQKGSSSNLAAPLLTLETLGVPIRGPFLTPRHRQIYLVDGCILTEGEIVALHERGKFAPEAIGRFLSDLKSLQTPGSVKMRRSQRVMLKLGVYVRAELPSGERLQKYASTVMVNAEGGLLEVPFRMTVGQKITLINPESRKEVGCRVIRVQGPLVGSFTAAFEFDERNPSFWPVPVPPPDWAIATAGEGK